MASDFTNPFYPADVDRDQRITALDALAVINRLNRDGVMSLQGVQGNENGTENVDVDGDNYLTPLDALSVINLINSGKAEGELGRLAQVSYRFFRANPDGTPGAELFDVVSGNDQTDIEVNVGERVVVRTQVKDLRRFNPDIPGTVDPKGVFSANHDLNITNASGDPNLERLKFQWSEINTLKIDRFVNGGTFDLRFGSQSVTVTPAVLNNSLDQVATAPLIRNSLESIFGAGNVKVSWVGTDNRFRDFEITFVRDQSRKDIVDGVVLADNLTTASPTATKASLVTMASPDPSTDKLIVGVGLNHDVNLPGLPGFVSGKEGTLVGVGTSKVTLSAVGGFLGVSGGFVAPEEVAGEYWGVVDALFQAGPAGTVILRGSNSARPGFGIALLGQVLAPGQKEEYLKDAEIDFGVASVIVVDQLSARPASFAVNEDSGQSTQNLSSNWTDRTTATARGIVSVTQPVGGTVAFDPNGSEVRFTPNSDFNGQAVFTYVLRNNLQPNPIETIGTVTFTVAAVNDAPNDLRTSFSVAEDAPGGPLVIIPNGVTSPNGIFSPGPADESSQTVRFLPDAIVLGPTPAQGTATIDNVSGALEFRPAADFFGPVVIQVRGTDDGLSPNNQATVATITINVTPVNDAPRVVSSQFGMQEDGTLNVAANQIFAPGPANESNQTVTLTLTQPVPAGVSIEAGVIVVKPPANSFAPISFSVTGTDNGINPDNLTNSTIVTITVNPVNDPPIAVNDPGLGVTGIAQPQVLDVLLNDSPGLGEDSIDDIRVILVPGSGDLIPKDANGNILGTATIGQNGSNILYTPQEGVFDRTVSFTYTIADNDGATAKATATVYIAPPARPYALDDNFTIAEDEVEKPFDVLSNDFGFDGIGKTLVSFAGIPDSQGTLRRGQGAESNILFFQPASNFFGPVTFTYVMASGTQTEPGSRPQAVATIMVTEKNDPPVAANRNFATDEDIPITILPEEITNGLNRGPGEVAQSLTISFVNNPPVAPSVGTVTRPSPNGPVVFTPFKDFFGIVDIVYNVTDNGTTNGAPDPLTGLVPATIQITVNAVNDPPIANGDSTITAEDIPISIPITGVNSITANDRPGPDNEISQGISFVPVVGTIRLPSGGTVSQPNNGNNLIYTPPADFNGVDTFTYEVQDGLGLKSTGTVSLTITEVNDAPRPTPVTRSMFASVPTTFDLSTTDFVTMPKGPANESGQTLRIVPGSQVVNTTPNGNVTATLNANGTITFFAPLNTSGRQTFSYQIEDNGTTNGILERKGAVGIFHVDVLPFIPSDFRGVVYVDDNLNGVPDTSELRIAGADVTLTIPADPSTPGSRPTQRKAVTDTAGTYFFDLLPPGAYTVSYAIPMITDDRPDHLNGGANTLSRTISAPGDAHFEVNFAIQGIKSSQISILDNISWNYMIGNGRTDLIPKGLYAAVGADGKSEWTMARDTFKSDTFHELVLSDDGTRAFLTALRGNELFTATLNRGQFFAVPDSAGNKLVRVLASKEELTWQRVNMAAPPVTIVSRRYLDAVDEYFASEG